MNKPTKYKEIIGVRFNRFVILEELQRYINVSGFGFRMVRCKCDCGNIIKIRLTSITSGQSKSCGCLTKETNTRVKQRTTHGLHAHPLYDIFSSIKQRCYDQNCPAYPNYGGRGVVICDEWLKDFKLFYNWAITHGWRRGLEIDKDIKAMKLGIPPLLYSPEMCSIVTTEINCNSRRTTVFVELNGERMSLTTACKQLGITRCRIDDRMKKGMSFEEAVKNCQNVG